MDRAGDGGPGTPVEVVAAFTTCLAHAVARQDAAAHLDEWLHSSEPSFTTPRVARVHPVEGSLDALLAHTRLRLAGWTANDDALPYPGLLSHAPAPGPALFSDKAGPFETPALPRMWTLAGGTGSTRWDAMFSSRTPTELVIAAAQAARHIAAPAPGPDGKAPGRRRSSEHSTAHASAARTSTPPPAADRAAPTTGDSAGPPPPPPRRR
ncbi:hypothetical protein [Kitasatospora sp. Root107]|uniref:hypothetical protein n=1 Tax=Kitasatospora sp. Root107 TaxID=1736424 RepID=UPI00070C3FB6|nr:hypothetical protein [Kitasatospora sp. Root107]KQV20965.1 hypothetical protein ASC99_20920 [Kitasatospora sp. Root107]